MHRHALPSHGPSGFIVVNKPAGMTSFDVIRELRRVLRIKKLGHSGVLDRPAMGVLVVGAGQATRLFELFGEFEKEYEADVWLGLSSNTDDLTGELLTVGRRDPHSASEQELTSAIATQLGVIEQLPPLFSLTKVDGRELYRYALSGEAVEIKPKQVRVHNIEVLADDSSAELAAVLPPESKLDLQQLAGQVLRRVRLRISCSGGVYVRSIARDVGAQLGCGGCLGRLVRTQVGPFRLEAALTLEQVQQRVEQGASPASLLQPLSSIATAESSVPLDSSQLAMVANGRSIRRFSQQMPGQAGRGATVYGLSSSTEGPPRLVAVMTVGDTNPQGLVELRPRKVLFNLH